MRVEGFVRDDVSKLDSRAMFDVFHWLVRVVVLRVVVNRGIQDDPVVILIAVRVERDLLFFRGHQSRYGQGPVIKDARPLPPG